MGTFCYAVLLALIAVIEVRGTVADCSCNQKSLTYLDAATDMIAKAKVAYPVCHNSNNHTTLRAADCEDYLKHGYNTSGVYAVRSWSRVTKNRQIDVFCDMSTDGGGWTVIQRRGNFSREKDYFFKDWESYKTGFGDIQKDFWLGNDNIFALSNQKLYSVRFDLQDLEGEKRYAQYDVFWIDDETQKYKLHIADYSGDAGDSMIQQHNNNKFSTKDQDNDNQESHCAELYKGGWWYNACHHSNLNGLYLRGRHESFADGVDWLTWKGYNYSLDKTEIKIRSKDFRQDSIKTVDTPETPMR